MSIIGKLGFHAVDNSSLTSGVPKEFTLFNPVSFSSASENEISFLVVYSVVFIKQSDSCLVDYCAYNKGVGSLKS